MEASGLPQGAEVLVAGYNYYVVVQLIIQMGLKPVFVDIDPETLTIDPADMRRKISSETRMVVVTHMFGIPADMAAIKLICDQRQLLLFEDCAHGVGTFDYQGQVGKIGHGALFSLGPQKILTAFGGGILALAPDFAPDFEAPELPTGWKARMMIFAKALLTVGMRPFLYGWIVFPLTKIAFRLAARGSPQLRDLIAPPKDLGSYRFTASNHPPFQPFMLRMCERQLARIEENVRRRREFVRTIQSTFGDEPGLSFLNENKHGRANGSYFGVYVEDSEKFTAFMRQRGVEVNAHEFYDCSEFRQFQEYRSDCPCSRYASEHLVRLPSYPGMTRRDIARVTDAIRSYLSSSTHTPSSPHD
jgi:dTDP-4-amino-4,6-dideoxygalactose transaminase